MVVANFVIKGMFYNIMDCKLDGCDAGYEGETHRNAYTRRKEHIQKYERKDENSMNMKLDNTTHSQKTLE